MTDTSSQILDVSQELIQTRGYTVMTFQDIATRVGIKKPSVIHHFPSISDLGVAIIQRYSDTFASQLEAIKKDPHQTAWEALEFYFSPYLHFAETPNKVCLCNPCATSPHYKYVPAITAPLVFPTWFAESGALTPHNFLIHRTIPLAVLLEQIERPHMSSTHGTNLR